MSVRGPMDGVYDYDAYKTMPPEDRDGPGTVKYYQGHSQCLARINKLTDLLNEIAAIAAERADSDYVGEHERYEPNSWWRIHMRIREVVPR